MSRVWSGALWVAVGFIVVLWVVGFNHAQAQRPPRSWEKARLALLSLAPQERPTSDPKTSPDSEATPSPTARELRAAVANLCFAGAKARQFLHDRLRALQSMRAVAEGIKALIAAVSAVFAAVVAIATFGSDPPLRGPHSFLASVKVAMTPNRRFASLLLAVVLILAYGVSTYCDALAPRLASEQVEISKQLAQVLQVAQENLAEEPQKWNSLPTLWKLQKALLP